MPNFDLENRMVIGDPEGDGEPLTEGSFTCPTCEREIPEEFTRDENGKRVCINCAPKCAECDRPAADGGQGACAMHELELLREFSSAHAEPEDLPELNEEMAHWANKAEEEDRELEKADIEGYLD